MVAAGVVVAVVVVVAVADAASPCRRHRSLAARRRDHSTTGSTNPRRCSTPRQKGRTRLSGMHTPKRQMGMASQVGLLFSEPDRLVRRPIVVCFEGEKKGKQKVSRHSDDWGVKGMRRRRRGKGLIERGCHLLTKKGQRRCAPAGTLARTTKTKGARESGRVFAFCALQPHVYTGPPRAVLDKKIGSRFSGFLSI